MDLEARENASVAPKGTRPWRLIGWLGAALLAALTILWLTGRLSLSQPWLRLGFLAALAALWFGVAVLLRRLALQALGLFSHLASLAILSSLLPSLLGAITQGGPPTPPTSALGSLTVAFVLFGAVSLYYASWDAPPLSLALVLSGGLLLLRGTEALPAPSALSVWTIAAFGAVLSLGAAWRSLVPSDSDHAFWIGAGGLLGLSYALLPLPSPVGWLLPLVLLGLGYLFLSVERHFLAVLGMSIAGADALERALRLGIWQGILVVCALVLIAVLLIGRSLRRRSRPPVPHGTLWTD